MMASRQQQETVMRLEFWPTSEGVHVVEVHADGTVRLAGVLWIGD